MPIRSRLHLHLVMAAVAFASIVRSNGEAFLCHASPAADRPMGESARRFGDLADREQIASAGRQCRRSILPQPDAANCNLIKLAQARDMADEKAHAFLPMTRSVLRDWVVPFSRDGLRERKGSYVVAGGLGLYCWIVPMIALDMLFTPVLLFAWLRGDRDVVF